MVHDFHSNLKELKNFQQSVVLAPVQWRKFIPSPALDWQNVKFGTGTIDKVPEQRGIYAFVVQFQDHAAAALRLPGHGYVMYAGITGERGVNRTLRDRFCDYLREINRGKRVQIWSMLNKWKDDFYFHYALVDQTTDLARLELALNDAIIPPYVTNDFSAAIRPLARVLRRN
jgi:hypothetical protein